MPNRPYPPIKAPESTADASSTQAPSAGTTAEGATAKTTAVLGPTDDVDNKNFLPQECVREAQIEDQLAIGAAGEKIKDASATPPPGDGTKPASPSAHTDSADDGGKSKGGKSSVNSADTSNGPDLTQGINACVDAMVLLLDLRFQHYSATLQAAVNDTNFAFDAVGLGLSAAETMAGASAAHILGAVATGVGGTQQALNNDILLKKSVEIVIHQMMTDRNNAYNIILSREKGTEAYQSLHQAAIDLYQLQLAGTWTNALVILDTCTSEGAATAKKKVQTKKLKKSNAKSTTGKKSSTETMSASADVDPDDDSFLGSTDDASASSQPCTAPSDNADGSGTVAKTASEGVAGSHAKRVTHAAAIKLGLGSDSAKAAATKAKARAISNLREGMSLGDAEGTAVEDSLNEAVVLKTSDDTGNNVKQVIQRKKGKSQATPTVAGTLGKSLHKQLKSNPIDPPDLDR
jgi:hypothetical protein